MIRSPHRSTTDTRSTMMRRRGSVLLLVLVSILILVLLGVAYLAMARIDRRANAEYYPENIDTVVTAIIAQIRQTLADDIISYDGTNVKRFAEGAMNYNSVPTGYDEPYDFPWTRDVAWPVKLSNGTARTARGGQLDDTWLASHAPDFSGTPTWPHITNLNGIFLRLPTSSGSILEMESAINAGTEQWRNDTNVRISGGTSNPPSLDLVTGGYQQLGVDADGDGVLDSKWTWAPIKQIGDVKYVMGVRIVDNSAMVNPSVAVVGDSSEVPRWYYPADLDLGNVLGASISDWLTYINNGVYGHPRTSQAFRDAYWFDSYGPSNNLPEGDGSTVRSGRNSLAELDLRNRFALNDGLNTTPIEEQIPELRDDGDPSNAGDDETSYGAVGTIEQYFANVRARISHYTGTGQHATAQDGDTSVNSGMMLPLFKLWSADPTTAAFARDQLRNLLLNVDMPFEPWASSSNKKGYSLTPAFGASEPANANQATIFARTAAAQYIAALIDYFDTNEESTGYPIPGDTSPDPDSTITRYVHSTDTGATAVTPRYGMEALPFLTEVYLQAAYHMTQITPAWEASIPDYEVTWTRHGNVGYIIEMVNPFSTPVRNLKHVRLRYQYANSDSIPTTWRYPISGSTTPDPDNDNLGYLLGDISSQTVDLAPNGQIYLWRNGGGLDSTGNIFEQAEVDDNSTDSGSTRRTRDMGDPAPTGKGALSNPVDLIIPSATHPDVTRLFVELQVKVDPDSNGSADEWVTYSRIKFDLDDAGNESQFVLGLPETVKRSGVTISVDPATVTDADKNAQRYLMRSAYCNPQGLNPIAAICSEDENEFVAPEGVNPDDWANPDPMLVDTRVKLPDAITGSVLPQVAQVGESTKTGATTDYVAGLGSAEYGFDDIRLNYVTDLYRVMWVGPYHEYNYTTATASNNKTYAEVFREALPRILVLTGSNVDPLRSRMLNFYADETRMAVSSGTLAPTDYLASTAAGSPNRRLPRGALLLDRVMAVPVLSSSTPIVGRINLNTIDEDVLAAALPMNSGGATLADQLTSWRTAPGASGTRTASGLKGIASLGELLQMSNVIGGGGNVEAFDGGGNPVARVPGNRDDEVRLAGYLANVAGVRSDYFTAYVRVRGYVSGTFDTPVEEALFVVVLDRSGVTSRIDLPAIRAFKRIK